MPVPLEVLGGVLRTVGSTPITWSEVYDQVLMIAIKNPEDLYGLIDELRVRGVTRFRQGELEFDMLPKAFDNSIPELPPEEPRMDLPVFGPRVVE